MAAWVCISPLEAHFTTSNDRDRQTDRHTERETERKRERVKEWKRERENELIINSGIAVDSTSYNLHLKKRVDSKKLLDSLDLDLNLKVFCKDNGNYFTD